MNLNLSQELVKEIVQYLIKRPYVEVVALLERVNAETTPQLAPQAVTAKENNNEQESQKA